MKKTLLTLTALSIVAGGLLISSPSVRAYRGDPAVQGPNYTAERHEAMEKAFATNDYNAWKNLMQGRGRVTQVVNKDNFAKFAKAHELAEDGKTQEAAAIRTELGLGLQNGSGRNGGGMGRNFSK
ncbi:MAG: hypothetical protein WC775_04430 [Patescibacteria group bacterium]